MTATGLAAEYPFEAWFVLDKSADPSVPGYEVPAGTTIRVTFPREFTPKPGDPLEAVLLYGWPQMAIASKFTVEVDPKDARTILLRLQDAVAAEPPARPGLKAIHLRASVLNPNKAGDFPVILTFENAGELTGRRQAMTHVTERPVPNIAAYNQLHGGRDEDWQHIKPGRETPIPVDYLVTLPGESRASVRLLAASGGGLTIVSDGKPIGSIKSRGVPVSLIPESFGPGYARLGIIRVRVAGGSSPGEAKIDAQLDGGTQYTVHIVIEP